jgi:hypothetical protein
MQFVSKLSTYGLASLNLYSSDETVFFWENRGIYTCNPRFTSGSAVMSIVTVSTCMSPLQRELHSNTRLSNVLVFIMAAWSPVD